jgi:hypothetical protein
MSGVFLAAPFAFLKKNTLDLLSADLGRVGLIMIVTSGAVLLD